MAHRPIFIPLVDHVGVEEKLVEFKWHSGLAKIQKQKSIHELHSVAKQAGIHPLLEISSKSEDSLGKDLSAFNLCIITRIKSKRFTVETAFQSSKVFENGGPYKDLLGMDSIKAKRDIRIKESGNLIGFDFFGMKFPLIPRTYFYDWLYINALVQNPLLAEQVLAYKGYSDIEFNPAHSINCQAHSVALFVSIYKNDLLDEALSSPEAFLEITKEQYKIQKRNIAVQNKIL